MLKEILCAIDHDNKPQISLLSPTVAFANKGRAGTTPPLSFLLRTALISRYQWIRFAAVQTRSLQFFMFEL
jgi:hypothetical protein